MAATAEDLKPRICLNTRIGLLKLIGKPVSVSGYSAPSSFSASSARKAAPFSSSLSLAQLPFFSSDYPAMTDDSKKKGAYENLSWWETVRW